MTPLALHIGINRYPSAPLAGCVNDARDFAQLTGGRLLLDGQATRLAILRATKALLGKLRPNQWGILTFSGHGTNISDRSGDEVDGRDEALVAADEELIVDDELRTLLAARHRESRLLVVTDACHSGTVHRLFDPPRPAAAGQPRYLPAALLPRVKLGKALLRARVPRPAAALANVVHFAGCRDHEFSYDAVFDGRPNGALTYHWLAARDQAATFAALAARLARLLPTADYPQTPVTNASRRALAWPLPF